MLKGDSSFQFKHEFLYLVTNRKNAKIPMKSNFLANCSALLVYLKESRLQTEWRINSLISTTFFLLRGDVCCLKLLNVLWARCFQSTAPESNKGEADIFCCSIWHCKALETQQRLTLLLHVGDYLVPHCLHSWSDQNVFFTPTNLSRV